MAQMLVKPGVAAATLTCFGVTTRAIAVDHDAGIALWLTLAALAMLAMCAVKPMIRIGVLRRGVLGRARVIATRRSYDRTHLVQLRMPDASEREVFVHAPPVTPEVWVAYDPLWSDRTVVIDGLPGPPQVTGDAITIPPTPIWPYLVAPAIAAALVCADLVMLLLRQGQ